MTTITLTPELGEAVEQAVERSGGQPVRVEDPRNHRIYFLHTAELRLESAPPGKVRQTSLFDVPEGIRRSQAAFLRDLPELLEDESLRGQWIAYHGDERVGLSPGEESLIQECSRQGLKSDQYEIFVIEATEEVDFPSSWLL